MSAPRSVPTRSVVTGFPFEFEPGYRLAARPFGVTAASAVVELTETDLAVRFGPWHVRTPLSNVVAASITGPYRFVKTAGPAHLSFSDRGLTFATNGRRGVFIEFAQPIQGIEPFGLLKHPNLTVTVTDVAGLVAALKI